MSRYGHLRSAPVVALVYARSGTTPRRASLLDSTRFGASSMAYRLSAMKVTDTFLLSRLGSTRITVQNFARDAERFLVQLVATAGQFRRSWILYCPRGLWVSMRHHVQLNRQLVSASDTGRHPVRSPVLMGCLALRRSWKIDAISLAYLPSRAVGVAAPPSFFGSPAHWRPLASQMFACSQLKTFRHPCAVLVPIAIYRCSA